MKAVNIILTILVICGLSYFGYNYFINKDKLTNYDSFINEEKELKAKEEKIKTEIEEEKEKNQEGLKTLESWEKLNKELTEILN